MTNSIADRNLLASLGAALEYPDASFSARINALDSMSSEYEGVQNAVQEFRTAIEPYSSDERAEIYTRTFDVAPTCIPYLSIHLFGEESFHRARLMVGLRGSLLDVGADLGTELPDHFVIVLKAAPLLSDLEWDDLVTFVLRGSLHAMYQSIAKTENPFRWLLKAAQEVVGPATEEDLERLQTARRNGKNHQPPGSKQSCKGC